ncbi:tellurite resistance TerB family protein [Litoreibacter roseus]|uniref:Tellurite resistance protein n=1 Tax=Litoreibacter roseus TaxID=2601869 RepID=A0A6N6JAK4_9RHOB|nr:tellurite resistance TerB family protein [Litoreibacter roseus]GFE63027.1 tellurite resistance protein [Litoreibacter roseus]
MPQDTLPFSAQDSLVAIMIAVSMSDANVRTSELLSIHSIVEQLPVFANYDVDRIKLVAGITADLFEQEDGLDAMFALVREQLPDRLFETAYALACDVGAADNKLNQDELRMLEEIRYELDIDRLHAAAIERGARARHATL